MKVRRCTPAIARVVKLTTDQIAHIANAWNSSYSFMGKKIVLEIRSLKEIIYLHSAHYIVILPKVFSGPEIVQKVRKENYYPDNVSYT